MIKERDIEKYLKKRVAEEGGEVRRVKWQGRRGAPDDVIFLNGAHFAECKAPGKTPDDHQEREHKRMYKNGVRVFIIDSYHAVDSVIWMIKNGH